MGSIGPVEVAVAKRALEGQDECGDAACVAVSGERVVLAAIDGLGHGGEAAEASALAVEVIADDPARSVVEHFERCHEELKRTRGAVMSIAIVSPDGRLSWGGIGNVESRVFRADTTLPRAREALMLRGGVVGYRIPRVIESTLPLAPGDVIVMVTDGIRSAFDEEMKALLESSAGLQRMADDVLRTCGRPDDDALVLVARLTGS